MIFIYFYKLLLLEILLSPIVTIIITISRRTPYKKLNSNGKHPSPRRTTAFIIYIHSLVVSRPDGDYFRISWSTGILPKLRDHYTPYSYYFLTKGLFFII